MKVKERKNYREVELFVDNDTTEEDDQFFYKKLTVRKEHSKKSAELNGKDTSKDRQQENE